MELAEMTAARIAGFLDDPLCEAPIEEQKRARGCFHPRARIFVRLKAVF
jgi:hypothetical protein